MAWVGLISAVLLFRSVTFCRGAVEEVEESCLLSSRLSRLRRSSSTIVNDHWRFTAVTDRSIRIEYDEEQRFVDEPTSAFIRSTPLGTWDGVNTRQAGFSILQTRGVTVRYRPNQRPSRESLSVSSVDGRYTWSWGDDPAIGNLRGTARTMDGGAQTLNLNCHEKVSPSMNNDQMHCQWGLVSKMGWSLVNDTGMPILRDGWFASSRNTIDVTVFLHGLDFSGALQDFAHAAGRPGLPPRYAFGTMFTRWFNFDADAVGSLVDEFEERRFPLDAWIFDMNWHSYGEWGSFTWNKDSFPKLHTMLSWFKQLNLPVGANMHEAGGITNQESTYPDVCAALGCVPGRDIEFDLYNQTYTNAQENIALAAIMTKPNAPGIDFTWIDYQQGENDTFGRITIPNLNPTIVLNTVRSRVGEHGGRPLIVSRWGGLGSHRYPVGFSGDQHHSWQGLAFLPYFTSTAANVLYGYWSHDTVGGHHSLAHDYEFSVRWFQAMAWSPVLRIHDKGCGTGDCATDDVCARVVPWDLPDAFYVRVRESARLRDELVPYIYTAALRAAFVGSTLIRPMYFENSSDETLYDLGHQYLFGPDMVISPITSPSVTALNGSDQALGFVEWTVYAPRTTEGWFDRINGDFAVERNITNTYGIGDVPGLIRQGAVLPMRPRLSKGESSFARAAKVLDTIDFRIIPAEGFYTGAILNGSGSVDDDDGVTAGYLHGAVVTTKCTYTFDGRIFNITFEQHGDFPGRPVRPTVKLSFLQLPPLTMLSSSGFAVAPTFTYDHEFVGPVLTFLDVDLASRPSVQLAVDAGYHGASLAGLVGSMGRVRRARYVKNAFDAANIPYGRSRTNLTSYVLAATHMTPTFSAALPQLWDGIVAEVSHLTRTDPTLQTDARRTMFVRGMVGLGPVVQPTAAPAHVRPAVSL